MKPDAECLADFLAGRDVACPSCGYNLRDLTSDHCPECARAIALHVGSRRRATAGYVAGVIAIACGVGFSGGLLACGVLYRILSGAMITDSFAGITAGGLLVELLALVIWLACAARIDAARRGARVTLVILCWLLTLAELVAVFMVLSP